MLVVYDKQTTWMSAGEILDLGYVAVEATNSAAGLKLLQSDIRIDLLMIDATCGAA